MPTSVGYDPTGSARPLGCRPGSPAGVMPAGSAGPVSLRGEQPRRGSRSKSRGPGGGGVRPVPSARSSHPSREPSCAPALHTLEGDHTVQATELRHIGGEDSVPRAPGLRGPLTRRLRPAAWREAQHPVRLTALRGRGRPAALGQHLVEHRRGVVQLGSLLETHWNRTWTHWNRTSSPVPLNGKELTTGAAPPSTFPGHPTGCGNRPMSWLARRRPPPGRPGPSGVSAQTAVLPEPGHPVQGGGQQVP